MFTVQLRGPTVAPSKTQSWFPVLKIECNFLECLFFYMYFLSCFTCFTFCPVVIVDKVACKFFLFVFLFFANKKTFVFCPILSVNKNQKAACLYGF